jgi:uncharacterized paraquat-inducible protein A
MRLESDLEHWNPHSPRLQRLFPELSLFHEDRQREYAWRKAARRVHWAWGLIGCVLIGLGVWLLIEALEKVAPGLQQYDPGLSPAVPVGAGLMVAPLLLARVFYRRVQKCLSRELIKYGYPVCMECGYDLRGQTQPRCPECGAPFNAELLKCQNEGASYDL